MSPLWNQTRYATFLEVACTPENYELVERLELDTTSIRGYCTQQVPYSFNASSSILHPSRMKIIECFKVRKYLELIIFMFTIDTKTLFVFLVRQKKKDIHLIKL